MEDTPKFLKCDFCGKQETQSIKHLSREKSIEIYGFYRHICGNCHRKVKNTHGSSFTPKHIQAIVETKQYSKVVSAYNAICGEIKKRNTKIAKALREIKKENEAISTLNETRHYLTGLCEGDPNLTYIVAREKANIEIGKEDIRRKVFQKDNYRCVSCGTTYNLTVDHIIPVVHGGSSDPDNLQTLCKSCNCKKGSSMPYIKNTEFTL
jgi:hypothetical protein